MTVLGILLILVAVGMFVVPKFMNLRTEVTTVPDGYGGNTTKPAHPKILTQWTLGKTLIMTGVGVVVMVITSCFFYAKPGHQYYVVYPTGHVKCEFNQGWKMCMPSSRIQEWESFTDIKVVKEGESVESIEGPIMGGIPIRFIDKVVAEVVVSVRMQLPQDVVSFKQLVEEFRHPKNLITNTLIPTVKEQVVNTGYMFTAEDYVSGDASNFRATLDEQLKNGGYAVDKIEHFDTIKSLIQDENDRGIKDIQTRYEVNKRLDGNGRPIRIAHDITKNKIIVSQVIVDQVVLESKFRKKLEDSRDISAQKSIELQKVETAKAAQQRIVAEGERDKAAERVTQETEQVKALIAIETKMKTESTKKDLAKISLETAKLEAAALKVKKDAEAYANKRLVQAGLTPQEKAEWDYKTKVDMMRALSGANGITLPKTVFTGESGGRNGGSGMLESILGAKILSGEIGTTK